jgi:hypothetical protein
MHMTERIYGIFKLFLRICWIVPKKYLLLLDQTILLHFSSGILKLLLLPGYWGKFNSLSMLLLKWSKIVWSKRSRYFLGTIQHILKKSLKGKILSGARLRRCLISSKIVEISRAKFHEIQKTNNAHDVTMTSNTYRFCWKQVLTSLIVYMIPLCIYTQSLYILWFISSNEIHQ